MAVLANEVGKELLDKMGIESDGVNRIIIDLRAGDVAKMTLYRFITNEHMEKTMNVMERYELVPKEEDKKV